MYSHPAHQAALEQLFAYINAYTGMAREDFDQMATRVTLREFASKQFLIQPGQTEMYFNYIVNGVARKYIQTGKKETTLQLSTEGHFIHAEISFHTRQPTVCFVQAIEPTTFLSLHYDSLQELFDLVPAFNKAARLMLSEMYIRKELRDLAMLRLTAKERFLRYMHKRPEMLQRVPQKYIASYLNIKPETFSRLKHLIKLQK